MPSKKIFTPKKYYTFDLIPTLIGLFNEVHAFVITFMAGSKIEGVDKDVFSS